VASDPYDPSLFLDNLEMTSMTQQAPSTPEQDTTTTSKAFVVPPSYTKLAMRNMVRKRGTSLKHFALTLVGLLTVLVGLSYLTR